MTGSCYYYAYYYRAFSLDGTSGPIVLLGRQREFEPLGRCSLVRPPEAREQCGIGFVPRSVEVNVLGRFLCRAVRAVRAWFGEGERGEKEGGRREREKGEGERMARGFCRKVTEPAYDGR